MDWLRFHERNIIKESVANWQKIEAGQIVRFNYKGEYARVKRPLVLVLNPNWQGKIHAVSLDVIDDKTLLKLYNIVKETTAAKLQQLIKLRLPLLKADIKFPQKFYETRLKPFIKTNFSQDESPYRTYIRHNVTNLKLIDYRFKDIYIGNSDDVAVKEKEKTIMQPQSQQVVLSPKKSRLIRIRDLFGKGKK